MQYPPAPDPHATDRCTAHRRDGERCGNPPMHGTTVCRMHGGKSPRLVAKVQRERVAREAARLALHLERDQEPGDVLMAELRRACALGDYYEDLIANGTVPLTTWSETGVKQSVETELWQKERDRAISIAATCIKLGLEERRVRLAESEGRALANALRGMARDLGVADHPGLHDAIRRALDHMTIDSTADEETDDE